MFEINKDYKMPLSVLLLILIDQYIKIYISNNLINNSYNMFSNIVEFRPHLNTSYSWLNSLSNFVVGLLPHIVFNIIILYISILVFHFIRHKQKEDRITNLIFIFLFSGVICSLTDKIFWGGSLNYL